MKKIIFLFLLLAPYVYSMENGTGEFTLYVGPMFAGKTSSLMEEIQKRTEGKPLIFKHIFDEQRKIGALSTHNQQFSEEKFNSKGINTLSDILGFITDKTDSIFIDELQFFNSQDSTVIEKLLQKKIKIYAASLDLDCFGRDFGPIGEFKKLATEVVYKRAMCDLCKKNGNEEYNAIYTQRVVDGKAVIDPREGTIKIGGQESYYPVCAEHFIRASK